MNYYAGPWDYEAHTAFVVYHHGLNVSYMSFLAPTTVHIPVPMRIKASMPCRVPRNKYPRRDKSAGFKLEIYMIN